jgi:homoserine kinase
VTLRAPASSANIGAGFDCAAVALDLWNELDVTSGSPGEVEVVIDGVGEDELPRDETNLSVRAFALFEDPSGKRFHCRNRIPLERGLGSSAAAIALGLVAARPSGDPDALLEAALSLEGHGDNLACALLGGVTLTWEGRVARIAGSLPLDPVAVIPRTRLKTALSRHGLPSDVPHADAAVSVGRAAILGAAVATGDRELFVAALHDRLHEPYRPSPVLDAIRSDLPTGARGATLSGSGTTVIVWAEDAAACAAALRERFAKCEVHELAVVPTGALG